jgi:hypothetical protein
MLALVVLADGALLLAGGRRSALLPALLHAFGRAADPETMRRSAEVWLAAARNAWILTALAAVAWLGRALGGGPSSLGSFAAALVGIGMLVAFGAALALAALLPALRLAARSSHAAGTDGPGSGHGSPPTAADLPGTCAGLVLLAVLLAWSMAPTSGGAGPAAWLLHWPAVLAVAGATVAIALYLGDPGSGTTLTGSVAVAGTLGALTGLAQALHGFGSASIQTITGGIMMVMGSCFSGLLGLVFAGLPRLDRMAARGEAAKAQRLARLAAIALPALALLMVALIAAMVLTPITRKAG